MYHSANEEVRVTENVYETGIAFTGKGEDFKLNIKSIDNNNTISIEWKIQFNKHSGICWQYGVRG